MVDLKYPGDFRKLSLNSSFMVPLNLSYKKKRGEYLPPKAVVRVHGINTNTNLSNVAWHTVVEWLVKNYFIKCLTVCLGL